MTDILLFNQYFTSPKDAPQKIPVTLLINNPLHVLRKMRPIEDFKYAVCLFSLGG